MIDSNDDTREAVDCCRFLVGHQIAPLARERMSLANPATRMRAPPRKPEERSVSYCQSNYACCYCCLRLFVAVVVVAVVVMEKRMTEFVVVVVGLRGRAWSKAVTVRSRISSS